MTSSHFGRALRRWLRGLGDSTTGDASDGQLLERFVHQRDEAAFAALVQRHGPLVLGVSGRIVADDHDAEDVFQATFLVLACRAASIHRRQSLASFLYGTALRIARNLRARNTRRRDLHRRAAYPRPDVAMPADDDRETHDLLHEELNHLPLKYRDVLILCYMQGKTNEQAAHELGYPPGSLSRHLSRARELLRERLLARGVSVVLAAALAEQASATLPPTLVCGTLDTVRRHALASALLVGSTPPMAAVLAQGVLRTASWMRTILVSLLVAAGIGLAGGVVALYPPAAKEAQIEAKAADSKPPEAGARRDLYGDPLPDGVLVRVGTERLRHPSAIRIRFVEDGKTLMSVGQDQTVRFWDLATGKLQRLQRLPSSQRAMSLSADGKKVALTSDEHLHLWDIKEAKEIQRIPTAKLENEKQLNWVEFSPDGKMLAACNSDSTVLLWNVASGKEGARYKHNDRRVQNIAFSPDGKLLAAIGDQHIVIWDIHDGKDLHTITGRSSYFSRLAFSPDGKLLLESSVNAIRLCDVTTGKRLADLKFGRANPSEYVLNSTFAFAPDGKTLAIDLGDRIVLWDLPTRKEVKRLERCSSGIWRGTDWLAFSRDGKQLASLMSGKITLWDIVSGK
jgi:RNA polymerase sigma factor (sigma-70 family)